jgi:hypothetical protein
MRLLCCCLCAEYELGGSEMIVGLFKFAEELAPLALFRFVE